MAPPSSILESLPHELLTAISNHLSLPDLKRFRMACKTTAEAVFERMVTLMPRAMTVHGKRAASLRDLEFLGATFKMGAAIARLSIFHLRPEFGGLLSKVRLEGLVFLRLVEGKVEGEGASLVEILGNHRCSLREVRVEDFMIVVERDLVLWEETRGWSNVFRSLERGAGFRLRRCVFEGVGYCTPDGKMERYLRESSGDLTGDERSSVIVRS